MDLEERTCGPPSLVAGPKAHREPGIGIEDKDQQEHMDMMEIHSNINITVEMEATDSLVMEDLLLEQVLLIQQVKLPQ